MSKAKTVQGLADHQTEAALVALLAGFPGDYHPALDFLDDLGRADLVVLAAGLAESLVDELVSRKQRELMITEEEARQQVTEEARARAARCADLRQQAEAEQ